MTLKTAAMFVLTELHRHASSHSMKIVHVPLLRLCEAGYNVAASTAPLGIVGMSTHPRAHGTRSSTMGPRRALGRPTTGCIPVGAAMLLMGTFPFHFQDPVESEEMTKNDDLYHNVHSWYVHHRYARGTPEFDYFREADLGELRKTIVMDGIELQASWLTDNETPTYAEPPHFLYKDIRAACNPIAKLLIVLVKGCHWLTGRTSGVSGHYEAWQCDTHMRCGHHTKVDRGHLRLRTWYIYLYDLGGIGEITSRLQRLLDACGPGGKVHYIT